MKKLIQSLVAIAVVAGLATPSVQAQETKRRVLIVKDGKVVENSFDDGENTVVFPRTLVRRGFLGVHMIDLTPELRDHFRVAKNAGVLVSKVLADSPANRGGLKAGDIITSVDGTTVDSASDIGRIVRAKKNGDSVKVEFTRDGVPQQANLTMVERDVPELDLGEIRGSLPQIGPEIHEFFSSPEWKARMEAAGDCAKMQTRLRDLETKLKDLEKKLQK